MSAKAERRFTCNPQYPKPQESGRRRQALAKTSRLLGSFHPESKAGVYRTMPDGSRRRDNHRPDRDTIRRAHLAT